MDADFRKKTSTQLYRAAWTVEVVAVLLGLGISIAVGFDGWESLQDSNRSAVVVWINVLISAAPFLLVALVELTKIPISGAAYYAARWYWKILFTFGLIFVAFVTFETMFNGLERNFASLKYSMDVKMDEYTLLQEQSGDLIAKRTVAEELTLESIETAYNTRLTTISEDFEKAAEAVEEKYESQRKATSDEYMEELRADKGRLAKDIEALRQRHDSELIEETRKTAEAVRQAETALENKRVAIQRQINNKTTEINDLNQSLSEVGAFSFSRKSQLEDQLDAATASRDDLSLSLSELVNQSAASEVKSSQSELRDRHAREISVLSKQLETKNSELSEALKEANRTIDGLNKAISLDMAPLLKKRNQQDDEATKWRATQIADLQYRSTTIDELNTEISSLAAAITELRGEINSEGRSNQVYRMAASFYDKDNISELSPSQIALIAAIWFGSLATIVACAGILLAFGSYAVKAEPKDTVPQRSLIHHLRMLIAAIKLDKRAPREVEVVKEIEVIKKITIPGPERIVDREVKVREEVFVPVPATPSQLAALMEAEKANSGDEVAA